MGSEPTIAITGATLWGNRGAEAMLVTTIGQVRARRPDARIILFSYFPRRDRALLQDARITVIGARPKDLVLRTFPFAVLIWLAGLLRLRWPDRLLPHPARALRRCDALLDISGISFADGREKFLPFNILLIWPAMLLGVPVIKLAQALGPFKNPLTRLSARLFLPRCRRVYARGAVTAGHLRDLRLPASKWEQAADIGFLYQPEYSLTAENEDRVDALATRLAGLRAAGRTIIGLVPSSLVHTKTAKEGGDYAGVFVRLVRDLGGPDVHFVVVPNATRQGSESFANNDLPAIAALRERLARDLPGVTVDVVDYDLNTAGSRRLFALCDAVLTSRFHAMVSALTLGVPPVVIGWSHKYAEVLAEFGIERFAVDFADPHADVSALVRALLDERAALRTQIAAALEPVRAAAAAQFASLDALLT
jgi:polysaccharide pyruvyl transferase WcaK-like protein